MAPSSLVEHSEADSLNLNVLLALSSRFSCTGLSSGEPISSFNYVFVAFRRLRSNKATVRGAVVRGLALVATLFIWHLKRLSLAVSRYAPLAWKCLSRRANFFLRFFLSEEARAIRVSVLYLVEEIGVSSLYRSGDRSRNQCVALPFFSKHRIVATRAGRTKILEKAGPVAYVCTVQAK